MKQLPYIPSVDIEDVRTLLEEIGQQIMGNEYPKSMLGVVKTTRPLESNEEERLAELITGAEETYPGEKAKLLTYMEGYEVLEFPVPFSGGNVRHWLADFLEWCQIHNYDPETLAYVAALIHPTEDKTERWHLKMFSPDKIDTKILERVQGTDFFSATEWNDGHIDPVFNTYFRNPFTAKQSDIDWTRGE